MATIDIFSSSPGGVAVFRTAGAAPMSLSVEGLLQGSSAFDTMRSIVTAVGLRQGGNYQFVHTLKSMVYVYAFGERLGDVSISGLCFLSPCQGQNGIESIFAYYDTNRLSSRGSPVAIAIGASIVLSGFLVDLELGAQDAFNAMGQFTLLFKYANRIDSPRLSPAQAAAAAASIVGLGALPAPGLAGAAVAGVQ